MSSREDLRTWVTMGTLALVAASLAGQQRPVFRSSSAGVSLFVGVEDRGRPVSGLTADDFVVLDNGVKQDVSLFSGVDRLSVVVALDVSESTGLAPLVELQRAATHALDALGETDSSALITFGDRVSSHNALAQGTERTRRGIADASPLSGARTALWDAVLVGAGIVSSGGGRPVLVVATDGCDNSSWATPQLVGEWLGRTDLTVDFFWFGASRAARGAGLNFQTGDYGCPGSLGLLEASRQTAGVVMQTDRKNLKEEILRRIQSLRSGYQLTYIPVGVSVADGWHKLEVRLRPGVRGRVTARPGYFAGPVAK